MANIGSQKLYNTARAGNGPLLRFMLSCPENLSPWNKGKLQVAINGAGDKVESVLIQVGQLPTEIGVWARDRLENVIGFGVDDDVAKAVMRDRLDKGLALYSGEFHNVAPSNIGSFLTYATVLEDYTAMEHVLSFAARVEYNESREDDFCQYLHTCIEGNYRGQKNIGTMTQERLHEGIACILTYGTTQREFQTAYPQMAMKLVSWEMPDLATYLFDSRHELHFLDSTQQAIYKLLSPEAKKRLLDWGDE